MKITDIRTVMVDVPVEKTVISPDIKSFGCVLVSVDTDEGMTGESLLFTFGTKRLAVLNDMVLSSKSGMIGEDPHYTERIWRKLWGKAGSSATRASMCLVSRP